MEVNFFANLPNFIEEKDSEIKIWCHGGSGGNLFFLVFEQILMGKNGGPPKITDILASVFVNLIKHNCLLLLTLYVLHQSFLTSPEY